MKEFKGNVKRWIMSMQYAYRTDTRLRSHIPGNSIEDGMEG